MIDFVGKKKIWFTLSGLITLAGILSLIFQGLNFGIDFTGGTLLDLKADKQISVQVVREDVLKQYGLEDSSVQLVGKDGKEVIIRTKVLDEKKRAEVLKTFGEKIGKYDILQIEKISGVIGKELIWQAVLALVIASILMVIYITVRFEHRFAISGIIGILHDVFIVITFFSIFQFEIDSSFVAVILTIIGYSINDTIVVFDRFRENLRTAKRGESAAALANKSINQTLARCINTTGTTLVTLLALVLFGGATIHNFVIGLFIGIASGAYSSIFICSPIWVVWKEMSEKKLSHNKGVKPALKKA